MSWEGEGMGQEGSRIAAAGERGPPVPQWGFRLGVWLGREHRALQQTPACSPEQTLPPTGHTYTHICMFYHLLINTYIYYIIPLYIYTTCTHVQSLTLFYKYTHTYLHTLLHINVERTLSLSLSLSQTHTVTKFMRTWSF